MKMQNKNRSNSQKFCGFIEEAKFRAFATPGIGPKFNPQFTVVDKKLQYPKIYEENPNSKDKRLDKLVVNKNEPGPGDYDSLGSWKNTKGNIRYKFGNDKLVSFTDMYKKRKSYIPGSGHYKYDVGHVYSKLSMSPVSVRTRRH